jgi:hypothetical protein
VIPAEKNWTLTIDHWTLVKKNHLFQTNTGSLSPQERGISA